MATLILDEFAKSFDDWLCKLEASTEGDCEKQGWLFPCGHPVMTLGAKEGLWPAGPAKVATLSVGDFEREIELQRWQTPCAVGDPLEPVTRTYVIYAFAGTDRAEAVECKPCAQCDDKGA